MKALRRTCYVVALVGAAWLASSNAACAQAPMQGMGPVADLEKASWDNIQAGKFDAVFANWTPDFVYSGPEGLGGVSTSRPGLSACVIHSYAFGPSEYRMIGKDGVLISYKLTTESDCGPADHRNHFSGVLNCTSTWVKRNGKWMELAHTGAIDMMSAAPPPAPAQ